MDCKNCGTALAGDFCHNCGQKLITERFSLRQIISDLYHTVINVEKGFWFTLKELFTRPDQVISSYLTGATKKYYNPFRYYFIIIAVSALLQVWLGTFDLQQTDLRQTISPDLSEEELQRQLAIVEFMKKFLNFIPLIILPFIALFFKWMFRKQDWNYAEHLIGATFVYAQTTIIGIFVIIFFYFFPEYIGLGLPISFIISALYFAWTYGKVFGMNPIKVFFQSLLSIIGGFALMTIFMGILGIIGAIVYFIIFR